MNLFHVRFAVTFVLSLAILCENSSAQQIASALIREGETLPGSSLNISAINNSAANSFGGYAFTVTADGISNVWGSLDGGPGIVLQTEGVNGDLNVTGFESFFGISDTGATCYGTTSDNTMTGGSSLDGVFLNDMLLLNEDEPIAAMPGFFSTFNSRPGVTANGIPYWVGGITDAKGGSTQARVLFRGSDATPVIQTGDFIVGVPQAITPSGIDFDVRYSHCGVNYIMASNVDGGGTAVHINGVGIETGGTVLQSGNTIPISAGGIGDNFANFDFLGVGDNGNYLVTGDSDGIASSDEFIMVDGQIVLREGDMIGGATLAGTIEGAFMNDDGDWSAIWDADIGPANLEVLIFNGEIILTEGQQVDWNGDGAIDGGDSGAVIDNFTGITALTMSRVDASGTLRMYFTADVDVNGTTLEGGFCIEGQGNPITIGDVNNDSVVNLLDVAPFVKAIVSQTYVPAADINSDNQVDLLDVEPFIKELSGG